MPRVRPTATSKCSKCSKCSNCVVARLFAAFLGFMAPPTRPPESPAAAFGAPGRRTLVAWNVWVNYYEHRPIALTSLLASLLNVIGLATSAPQTSVQRAVRAEPARAVPLAPAKLTVAPQPRRETALCSSFTDTPYFEPHWHTNFPYCKLQSALAGQILGAVLGSFGFTLPPTVPPCRPQQFWGFQSAADWCSGCSKTLCTPWWGRSPRCRDYFMRDLGREREREREKRKRKRAPSIYW